MHFKSKANIYHNKLINNKISDSYEIYFLGAFSVNRYYEIFWISSKTIPHIHWE